MKQLKTIHIYTSETSWDTFNNVRYTSERGGMFVMTCTNNNVIRYPIPRILYIRETVETGGK